jgi:crotonobetainyl-CoA:carnitine CoA-transferase CaiB-like acyl-CoA transferase
MFIADAAGTANAIIGILAAVIGRNVTGNGQYIDISMTDATVIHNAIYAAGCLMNGESPDYENMPYNGGTLYDYYETKDKKYMGVASLEPQFYAAFYAAIGRPDLNSTAGLMPQNVDEVKKQIQDIFKTKTRDEWSAIFRDIDACVEPVLTLKEALENEHSRKRHLVIEVDLPQGGKVRQPALPIKFSGYQPEYKRIGVPAGFHNKEILQELGYTEEQIAEMEKTGIFD